MRIYSVKPLDLEEIQTDLSGNCKDKRSGVHGL